MQIAFFLTKVQIFVSVGKLRSSFFFACVLWENIIRHFLSLRVPQKYSSAASSRKASMQKSPGYLIGTYNMAKGGGKNFAERK